MAAVDLFGEPRVWLVEVTAAGDGHRACLFGPRQREVRILVAFQHYMHVMLQTHHHLRGSPMPTPAEEATWSFTSLFEATVDDYGKTTDGVADVTIERGAEVIRTDRDGHSAD